MATDAASWASAALGLVSNRDFQHEVAQIRAKALLKEVTDNVPQYNWTYLIPRVIRNSVAAAFGLEFLSRQSPGQLRDYEGMARQLALTWEALAKLGEGTNR